jgi:hypothetical protein
MSSQKLQVLYDALPESIRKRVTLKEVEEYILDKKGLPFVLQQLLESKVQGHTFVFALTIMHDKAKRNNCKSIEELDS